ncbi:MAG: formate dehydrogenase subunit gamma [Hyphomicrobium sp.]|nr:formate dehydrogenase subunit gamma [Hyphomicrobium sp.]
MTDRTHDDIPEAHVRVPRYSGSARVNHWIVAISFILLGLSGLALFHPSLFGLTVLFGGGQNARWLHPWLGIVLVIAFFGLFVRFVSQNLPERTDITWLARLRYALSAGGEDYLPEVGKYNAGQKFVFWSQTLLILVLLGSGLCLWQQGQDYLERTLGIHVSIETMRWAAVIHATAAVLTIIVFVIHVYSAIWVRGTIDAMTSGTVTGGWGWRHHRRWLRRKVREGDVDVEHPKGTSGS